MDKRFIFVCVLFGLAVGIGAGLIGLVKHKPRQHATAQNYGQASLSADGQAWQRLDKVHMDELARGVNEQPKGSNDSPRIREYQKAAGAPQKSAWCASYAYWAHKQAGIEAYRSPWCPDWAKHSQQIFNGRRYERDPRPGDFILIWGAKAKRYVHITSIHQQDGEYWITIGGNESDCLKMGRVSKNQVNFIGTYTGI